MPCSHRNGARSECRLRSGRWLQPPSMLPVEETGVLTSHGNQQHRRDAPTQRVCCSPSGRRRRSMRVAQSKRRRACGSPQRRDLAMAAEAVAGNLLTQADGGAHTGLDPAPSSRTAGELAENDALRPLRGLAHGCGDLADHFFDETLIVALAHDADHGLGARGPDHQPALALQALAPDLDGALDALVL